MSLSAPCRLRAPAHLFRMGSVSGGLASENPSFRFLYCSDHGPGAECVHSSVLKRPPGGKEPTCQCRDIRDAGLIPGLGRSPREVCGNPLQYSCLENPVDKGAWQAMVHRITESWTRLKQSVSLYHCFSLWAVLLMGLRQCQYIHGVGGSKRAKEERRMPPFLVQWKVFLAYRVF